MCGIVAYNGVLSAVDFLVSGIEQLEYRGYDSVGVALQQGSKLQIYKEVGRVRSLKESNQSMYSSKQTMGIAHTRWATHGKPSVANAHPHNFGRVTLVHNGIIDNYQEIIEKYLLDEGASLKSETDSEVVASLINQTLEVFGNPIEALDHVASLLTGSYALVVMIEGDETLYAMRKGSPLLLGFTNHGTYVASDMSPLLKHTKKFALIEEGQIAKIEKHNATLIDGLSFEIKEFEMKEASWNDETSDLGNYPHFMLKEINEQAKIIRNNFERHSNQGDVHFMGSLGSEFFEGINKVHIIACGTAYHAGLVTKAWIESIGRKSVEVHVASEFRYYPPILHGNECCVFISQSGETADVLACLDMMKEQGVKTLGIVNVEGSSIARSVDALILSHAGIEKSVASTKAYIAQLSIGYMLAHYIANKSMDFDACKHLIEALENVSEIHQAIKEIAPKYTNYSSSFFLGRGIDSYLALEGSLKLKEITYVHAESYPAGELKHGSIALIDDSLFTVGIALQSKTKDKTLSNLQEVKARGGRVLVITDDLDSGVEAVADDVIVVPQISDELSVFLGVIPLQFLAYEICVQKGFDVDYPRNLAKSVTVE